MTGGKQSLLNTAGKLHRETHGACDNVHKTAVKPKRDKTPVWRGELGTRSHL